MKRFAVILMAALIALALVCASAEGKTVEELEKEIELYYPYYERCIVAEYDGGVIMLDEVENDLLTYVSTYAAYGMNIYDYIDENELEQMVLEDEVKYRVVKDRLEKEGIFTVSEEMLVDFRATAESIYADNAAQLRGYFEGDTTLTDEEIDEQVAAYLTSMGYSVNDLVEQYIYNEVFIRAQEYVTKDVTVTEEDARKLYEDHVTEDVELYTDDPSQYEQDCAQGVTVYWRPEGSRRVKHILIRFTNEENTSYTALAMEKADLEKERGDADEARAKEIDERLAAIAEELDALYAGMADRAKPAYDKLAGGAAFEDVMDEFGEDPGMKSADGRANGYIVCVGGSLYDPAFEEGAAKLEKPGDIVEAHGSYGIHIMYLADNDHGDVAFESVRDTLMDEALSNARSDLFTQTVDAWIADAHPVYHQDRFVH